MCIYFYVIFLHASLQAYTIPTGDLTLHFHPKDFWNKHHCIKKNLTSVFLIREGCQKMDCCLSASVSDFTDQQVSPHKNDVSTTTSTKIATDQQGLCGDQQPWSSSWKSMMMAKWQNLHGAWSLEPHTCKGNTPNSLYRHTKSKSHL